VKQQLKIVRDRAKAAIDSKKAEADLKMKALRAQVEAVGSEAKARIEKRISEAQADFATRAQKLNRALALAKEGLGLQEDYEEPFSVTGFRLM
jgi:multidrug resistance efflux pump